MYKACRVTKWPLLGIDLGNTWFTTKGPTE
jgi:hypothetical protein